jgi:protein NrfD
MSTETRPERKLGRTVLRVAGLVLLLAATAVGGRAIVEVFAHGHLEEATTVHVPWGLWVALYIFLLGLSAGSLLVSTLATVFGVGRLRPVVPVALLSAFGCLLLAGLLILVDLGHPERMPLVLLSMNTTSPLAWMGPLYSVYALLILGQMYLVFRGPLAERAASGARHARLYRCLTLGRLQTGAATVARDRRRLRLLATAGLATAVAALMCEGSIFAVAKARPNWFGGLFAVVILVSAVASGASALLFLTAAGLRLGPEAKQRAVTFLARLMAGALLFEGLLLTSEILTVLYGGIKHEALGWRLALFGPYWYVFWLGQVGVGTAAPLALAAARPTRDRVRWLGLAGFLAVLGMVATRVNMVIPAQIAPTFEAMAESYHHARFAAGYWPGTGEFLVGMGVAALGVWMYLAARRWLPLEAVPAADDGAH